MPPASTGGAQRVAKRRAALRAQGLRPVQIWVPDSRAPGFAEECARRAAIVDAANRAQWAEGSGASATPTCSR